MANSKRAFLALLHGHPFGLFGVVPGSGKSVGQPWMLGTNLITTPAGVKAMARNMYRCDALLTKGYMRMFNLIDSRNEVHLRWLEKLGYTIRRDQPVHSNFVAFYPFTKDIS